MKTGRLRQITLHNTIPFSLKENKNNDFFSTIRLLSVSPHNSNAILEIIHWTQTVYALLYQPQHKDALFSFKSKRKQMQKTELLKKSCYFYFLWVQNVFSSLHKVHIEPMMADGLSWLCFSYFLGLDSVIYLAVKGTVTSLPVSSKISVPKTKKSAFEQSIANT